MKSKFYLPLIAMAIGMISCTNDLVEEVSPIMGQRDVIAVSVDNADTRTAMKDYNVVWSAGDAIGIFVGATNNAYALATGEGTSSAEFQSEGLIVASAETLKEAAYFPYVQEATWDSSTKTITTSLPATYEYAANTNNNAVMAALMTEDAQTSISFQNAGALYAITVENISTGYDKAVMTYLDNEDNVGIAGAATITFNNNGEPTLAVLDADNAIKTITITFAGEGDKTFYFPMPVKTEGYAGKLQFSLQGEGKDAITAPVFTKEPARSNLYAVTLKLDNVSGGIVSEANDIEAANAALANDAVTSVAVKDATDTGAITIPAKSESAADVEHTIDLSEATLPSTGSVAIVVEEGSGEKATVKKLTVIVPEGAEAGSYTINAPGTTVTIIGADDTVIETLEATTADNTLIICAGITIEKLIWNAGALDINATATIKELILGDNVAKSGSDYIVNGDSYTINTLAGLFWFADKVNYGDNFAGKTITLANNIDLQNLPWTPIGKNCNPNAAITFNGTFNGNYKTISNLDVDTSVLGEHAPAGLFGYASTDAIIKDLNISNVNVKALNYAGAVVGYLQALDKTKVATVQNCNVKSGTITVVTSATDHGNNAGGIAGYMCYGTTIDQCAVEGITITGYRDFGGIVGTVNLAKYKNKYVCTVTLTNNTAKDVTINQDLTNNYKGTTPTTIGEIYGRKNGSGSTFAESGNAATNVTI